MPVPPNRPCAFAIVLYYLVWNYHFRGDATAAGAEALRAVAPKSVEKYMRILTEPILGLNWYITLYLYCAAVNQAFWPSFEPVQFEFPCTNKIKHDGEPVIRIALRQLAPVFQEALHKPIFDCPLVCWVQADRFYPDLHHDLVL